jgi:predicted RNase H-like nuclease (RuvC/YqgF family)
MKSGVEGLKQAPTVKGFAAGPAIGAIATAAVIIAGAAIAFKALDKAWNKDAIAAKNAAKVAEQAAESYNSAKTEYENLQQTIESYSSAKNNLDGLVEGTLEFKEALIAANDEAHKLIEQYDNL